MNKRHYEHTLPNIRGSLSNTYVHFYNGFSDLTNVRIYGEGEEKGTRYPSECHH